MSEDLRQVLAVLRGRREEFHYTFADQVAAGLMGLYAFWLESGACLYVGQSIDIRRRLRDHKLREDNATLERWFRAFAREIQVSYVGKPRHLTGSVIASLEERAIHALRPLTNVRLQPR